MSAMRLTKAVTEALDEELAADERVFVMGVDVEVGVMGRTAGLAAKYPGRVRDTPISEAAVLGAGVGAAATGMLPIVDLMMSNFLYVAFDQIANNAGKLRYMMGGSSCFPLTILASTGAPGGLAAQHSDSPYAQVINAGGIKVVMPSTPGDAKGLLKAAIRDPNPVLYLLHVALSATMGEVPDGPYVTPLGSARVLREGTDVTIVAYGAMAHRSLEAAEQVASDGVSVEVVDPRTLHPFDYETVIQSVEKTGRLIVVDEARRSCSLASEIVARVCSQAFGALSDAPRILANPDVPVPFAPELEREVIPQVGQIVDEVRSLLATVVSR
jgi:pyruvate dehydrogenase E1 component beta subunit